MTRHLCAWALVLASAAPAFAAEPEPLSAPLVDAGGVTVGSVTVAQAASGLLVVNLRVTKLPAGSHGVHLHAVGRCEGPAFASAGAHFNPAGHEHGFDNPKGAHAGDLPNLEVAADGSGSLQTTTYRASLLPTAFNNLRDADGTALVVHARPDDQKTDPSGNSGGRIACAVLAPKP